MKIVLTHGTALEYWRGDQARAQRRPAAARLESLPPCLDRDEEVLARLAGRGLDFALPVHVLLAPQAAHANGPFVCRHSTKAALPSGSLLTLGEGIAVASPELCLLQVASERPLASVIAAGCALCGSYAEWPEPRFGCNPVTSPARLKSFSDRAEGLHGIRNLRRALPRILPDSASPMETALALLLSLPYSLGGYSLPNPLLNARIDAGKRAKGLVSQSFYRCDLYWREARLAVEYDSDRFHVGAEKIAKDSRRRNELAALGVTVVTVTSDQVFSWPKTDRMARAVAKRLGVRIRPRDARYLQRQAELRELLLGFRESPAGPRISDALGASPRPGAMPRLGATPRSDAPPWPGATPSPDAPPRSDAASGAFS